METQERTSNYWLELAADEIISRYPQGRIVVSSGISPSASYHIGHFREILTADALAWAVRQRGREVVHIHVVDNFDPLRKRYDFLPERFEEFVNQPVCLVPSPDETESISYADHFFNEFHARAQEMGVSEIEIVKSYEDLYRPGKMVMAIEDALGNIDKIRKVFASLSNRQLEANWSPVQVLNADGRFEQGNPESWDKAARTINGYSYLDGNAKLNWRLDWPARWRELKVQVEPFSLQEHGAAGSSYDTGVEFSEKIFHYPAPYPGARYGNIHLLGDSKKMSSSKGNLITPQQALQIMPPEILRYFVVRSRPEKTLYFDSGMGLYNLFNEYKQVMQAATDNVEHEFLDAYRFASAISRADLISTAPFQQLVMVYQSSHGDFEKILLMLERLGWMPVNKNETEALRHELKYVKNWLEKYAPEELKFSVQQVMPQVELSNIDRTYLISLATVIEEGEWTGEAIQDAIFQSAKDHSLPPREAFQLLYKLFIDRTAGPKLGPFLASLEPDFVLRRLRRQA